MPSRDYDACPGLRWKPSSNVGELADLNDAPCDYIRLDLSAAEY
jgi:hypothetical protein